MTEIPTDPVVVARFWSKIDPTGGPNACWLWGGGVDKDGYGKFQYIPIGATRQVYVRAHRLALRMHDPSKKGASALHRCDTPGCCNPTHLWWGTQLDNRRDCVAKRRQAKGESHRCALYPDQIRRGERSSQCKLTDEQVADIQRRFVPRANAGALAKEYGVHRGTIYAIGRGVYPRLKQKEAS